MKIAYGLLAVLLLAVSFALPRATPSAPEDVDWLGNLDDATDAARDSGRPMLVVFR